MLRRLTIIATLVASAACTKKNPEYCDAVTPCMDPATPYCDLTGEYGPANACIAEPGAGADASVESDALLPDANSPDAAGGIADAGSGTDGAPADAGPPDGCVPLECSDVGADCGMIDDGCGSMIPCGSCSDPFECGGTGIENVCGCPSGTWWIEIVDPDNALGGGYTSLELDASENVHISYYDGTEDDLKYANRSAGALGAAWDKETVDTPGTVGTYSSLAVDDDGVYISYYDFTNGNLKFAERATGAPSWDVVTVDSSANTVGEFNSIAVHSDGSLHVSYYDRTAGDLWYANRPSSISGWFKQVLTAADDQGRYTSIDIAADGGGFVGFYDQTDGDLRFGNRPEGTWTFETVDSAAFTGKWTSLEIDSAEGMHVAYSGSGLKYAYRPAGGSWVVEFVDAGTNAQDIALALDGDGGVHISYYDAGGTDLKYARRLSGETTWTIETPDTAGNTGIHTSIDVDASGGAHVSYYYATGNDVRYAYRCP